MYLNSLIEQKAQLLFYSAHLQSEDGLFVGPLGTSGISLDFRTDYT